MAAALSAKSVMVGTKVSVRPTNRVVAARATPITAAVKGPPAVLSNLEKLKLLSKVEQSGLLTTLEKSGLTLSKIESLGLLTTAENLGALSLVESRTTPFFISGLGAALLFLAVGQVLVIPDDGAALIALQAALFGGLVGGAGAAFAGSAVLAKLQE